MKNENKPEHVDKQHEHPVEKGFSIIVNGQKKTVEKEELTFDDVAGLAYDNISKSETICITIAYRDAGGRKSQGNLAKGETVKVKNGTVFNVTVTDKS